MDVPWFGVRGLGLSFVAEGPVEAFGFLGSRVCRPECRYEQERSTFNPEPKSASRAHTLLSVKLGSPGPQTPDQTFMQPMSKSAIVYRASAQRVFQPATVRQNPTMSTAEILLPAHKIKKPHQRPNRGCSQPHAQKPQT